MIQNRHFFRRAGTFALMAGLWPLAAGAQVPGHASTTTGTSAMTESPARTEVESGPLRLSAGFRYAPDTGTVTVAYRIDNGGKVDVAVFDRGNRQAVLTGRLREGSVATPAFHEDAPGDVSLLHLAEPLPFPSPTVPPIPLAARLAAGASLEGEFAVAPLVGQPPRRVRWCVGMARFDAQAFTEPQTIGGLEIWQGNFELADRQQRLCTPWFDVGTRSFPAG